MGEACFLKGQGIQETGKVCKIIAFPSFSYNEKARN